MALSIDAVKNAIKNELVRLGNKGQAATIADVAAKVRYRQAPAEYFQHGLTLHIPADMTDCWVMQPNGNAVMAYTLIPGTTEDGREILVTVYASQFFQTFRTVTDDVVDKGMSEHQGTLLKFKLKDPACDTLAGFWQAIQGKNIKITKAKTVQIPVFRRDEATEKVIGWKAGEPCPKDMQQEKIVWNFALEGYTELSMKRPLVLRGRLFSQIKLISEGNIFYVTNGEYFPQDLMGYFKLKPDGKYFLILDFIPERLAF